MLRILLRIKRSSMLICSEQGLKVSLLQFNDTLSFQINVSIVMNLKPQSHIHGFGPGRATVHPNLSNRGASA